MTLNQLECFTVLAQRLNYTQAANDLYMTQPALSRTIAALEQELEVRLFRRNSRGVALTPAGAAFLGECPAILEGFQNGVSVAKLAQQGYVGQISLGILRDSFEPVLVEIYRAMSRLYPNIHLSLREYSHSELTRHFVEGKLDAILNSGLSDFLEPDGLRSGCGSVAFRRSQQCVITANTSPLAERSALRMEELKDEPFVIMSRAASQPGHDFLRKAAADAGFVPKVAAEATHVPSLLTMVACGIGVSTMARDWEHMVRGQVTFIPLLDVPFCRQRLIWREDSDNPSLPLLIETVKAEVLPALERGTFG